MAQMNEWRRAEARPPRRCPARSILDVFFGAPARKRSSLEGPAPGQARPEGSRDAGITREARPIVRILTVCIPSVTMYLMPATLTDDEAAARRTKILSAARWCFLNFGFAKTAFEDIAKRAKLSRTLLYRIF